MYGQLTRAFVNCLRAWPEAKRYNLSVIEANETEGKVIVNTTIPCAAVSTLRTAKPTTFLGGGIYETVIIRTICVVDFTNFSASEDGGAQVRQEDIPHKLSRWIDRQSKDAGNKHFLDLRRNWGFSLIYQGFDTKTSRAEIKNFGGDAQTTKTFTFDFLVNVVDNDALLRYGCEGVDSVTLEGAELQLYDTDLKTGEDTGFVNTTIIKEKDGEN